MHSIPTPLRRLLELAAIGSASAGCTASVPVGDDVGVVVGDADVADTSSVDAGSPRPVCADPFGAMTLDACGPNTGRFHYLDAFAAPQGVDGLILRMVRSDLLASDPNALPSAFEAVGSPCSGATDPAACRLSLERLPFMAIARDAVDPWTGTYLLYDAVFSHGDEIGHVGSDRDVRDVLGTVDRPAEAVFFALGAFTDGSLDCTRPQVAEVPGGFEVLVFTGYVCGLAEGIVARRVYVPSTGPVTEVASCTFMPGDPSCVIGRLTSGTNVFVRAGGPSLGSRLAEIAALEAAAVVAFERLAVELAALGAPSDLVARAKASADDERRHAAAVARAARVRGGVPIAPAWSPTPNRSAFAIALENAQEGSVRETYGACAAWYQSAHANDPELRALARSIAEDETRHAAFSLDLARWLDGLLSDSERETVAATRDSALLDLRDAVITERAREDAALLGTPEGMRALAILDDIFPAAWSVATA